MAVDVERMSSRRVGVLFTADPVTGNRRIATVDAGFGLGEALVSGLVSPDITTVRDGRVVATTVAAKPLAVVAAPEGGTRRREIAPERRNEPALTDAQAVRLAGLGRRIEAHMGRPQDVEWCLADNALWIIQSQPDHHALPRSRDRRPAAPSLRLGRAPADDDRPDAATRPLPVAADDPRGRWPRPAGACSSTSRRFWRRSGSREGFLAMGRSGPIRCSATRCGPSSTAVISCRRARTPLPAGPPPAGAPPTAIETDPALVAELIERTEASVAAATREIQGKSGEELLDFILEDLPEMRRVMFDPQSHQAIMAGMEATWWLNDQLKEWLGEKSAADTLTQSVPTT